jgi:hypothetical protein
MKLASLLENSLVSTLVLPFTFLKPILWRLIINNDPGSKTRSMMKSTIFSNEINVSPAGRMSAK